MVVLFDLGCLLLLFSLFKCFKLLAIGCHCGLHLTYVGNFWATKSTFFVMKTI